MVEINVTIGGKLIDTVQISNTGKNLFGSAVYQVWSSRNKRFHVLHDPRHGMHKLIEAVFSHISTVENSWGRPIREEEV